MAKRIRASGRGGGGGSCVRGPQIGGVPFGFRLEPKQKGVPAKKHTKGNHPMCGGLLLFAPCVFALLRADEGSRRLSPTNLPRGCNWSSTQSRGQTQGSHQSCRKKRLHAMGSPDVTEATPQDSASKPRSKARIPTCIAAPLTQSAARTASCSSRKHKQWKGSQVVLRIHLVQDLPAGLRKHKTGRVSIPKETGLSVPRTSLKSQSLPRS